MESKKWPLWQLCLKNIRRRVGELATIRGFEACGYKADKKLWVVSFHYTVEGAGAFECGMDIMRAGMVPDEEGFDQSPYREAGSRQTMRMPGMSKTGENRPFKFINGTEGQWRSIDIWSLTENQRSAILTVGLAQIIGDEVRRDVPRPGEMLIGDEVVALGANGLPLGEDIKISTVAQVERLVEIAGWLGEVNRDYDTYCEEVWTAAACPNNDPKHVNELFDRGGGRSACRRRRLIAHLRKAAKSKDADAYVMWMAEVKKPIEIGSANASTMTFYDHNKFTGKEISYDLALRWVRDAMVYVENGGTSYFLTREQKTCELTNMTVEVWDHVSEDDMMRSLDTIVYIKNPKLNPAAVAVIEQKQKLGVKPTKEEEAAANPYMYFEFGRGTKKARQFMGDVLKKRLFRVVRREDFIPYLARRIPDANIAKIISSSNFQSRP